MIREGQIVLFKFPQVALVLRKLPGKFDDWPICMIRASRLAVVEREILLGKLGQIDEKRLIRLKQKIARWIDDG